MGRSGTEGPQLHLKPDGSAPQVLFSLKKNNKKNTKNTPQLLLFKSFWDVMKQVRDNQMANLEGHSKAGQSKPLSWVRKRGSETGWLTPHRSTSQVLQIPVGSAASVSLLDTRALHLPRWPSC